jgi:hypothetical protein
MSIPTCAVCGVSLAPAEFPNCFRCSQRRPTTIGERALIVLEEAAVPLSYWDIKRLLDRRAHYPTNSNSLLVYLSRDLRICWAGKGMYGLFRHGLVPNVRGLGPAAEVHLLAAPNQLTHDELHFVLQHQGYRYQLPSLIPALQRQIGYSWRYRSAATSSPSTEQRLGLLLQISSESPLIEPYSREISDRVSQALAERARRLM